jgi:CBS domain-containing protein
MRTVKDILKNKPVSFNIVDPGMLVIDALKMLSAVNLSYLIVKKNDEFKGIFCERDYSRKVILQGRTSADTRVAEVMTVDLPVVDVSDTVEYCMNLMSTHGTRYLLALDNQEFAGIITIHDLLRLVLKSKEAAFDHSLAEKLIEQEERGKIY